MGHSQTEKARNHERIVDIAAAQVRESGTDNPGVADIMRAAGLTHGGFYKHFASRDELIAEAVERSFAESELAVAEVTDDAEDPVAAFVDWYVSAQHRDHPASGCSVVALGAEAPRSADRVRAAYTQQVKRYLSHLEKMLGDGRREARREASVMLSTLVGSVLLARAVDDKTLSDEILTNVRDALKST
jgi:TetR/AcrR family transcriptional repressor of nem operon